MSAESDTAILRQIEEIVHGKLDGTGRLEPNLRLTEDLRLDSLRLLTLAMEVEDRFRICLDEDDEAGIRTVGDLVSLIQVKLTEEEAGA